MSTSAQKGNLFLIKLAATTISNTKDVSLQINNQTVDITNSGSAGVRELLASAGINSVTISASRYFY